MTFVIFSTQYGRGQSFAKEYSILANSKYGNYSYIVPTFDKGYIVTFFSNYDAPVVKTDSAGNIVWANKYSFNYYYALGGTLISQAPDSGFIIPGINADSSSSYAYISATKVDKFGNPQWTKSYSDSSLYSWANLSATTTNGFIICGTYGDLLTGEIGTLLINTDFSGNLVWANKVNLDTTNVSEDPTHMIITSDGGILIVVICNCNDQPILAKFNSGGNLLWAYQYPSIYGADPLYVMEDDSNNILVTGRTMSWGCQDDWDTYIMKFNSNGIFQWGKTFGDSIMPDEAYSINQLQNGDYLICAEVESFYAWTSQTALIRTDNNGNFQWMKLIHPDSTGSFPFNAVLNWDGSLTIARIEGDYSSFANLSLIRTDQNLVTPCTEMNVTPVITSFSVTGVSCGIITSTTGEANLTVIDSKFTITKTDLCPPLVEINEMTKSINNLIYPNPFDEHCILSFENPKNEKRTLTLFNTTGQVVQQTDNITTEQVKIEKENLSDGLYFYQLRTDKEVYATGKLMIK